MTDTLPANGDSRRTSGGPASGVLVVAAVIILAGLLSYSRALPYPFIFDDEEAITENPYVRSIWPVSAAMSAPAQSPVAGRPIVSLTLALNFHFGGLHPAGYRAFNILVHVLAGLTLFGIIRRTLLGKLLSEQFGQAATPLAAAATLAWLLHPLQTESVTYVIQRTECMMGLFYLLTLYCAIRGFGATRPAGWYVAAIIACALGMATKEVMVTAPVLVLLYDRIFVGPSFSSICRRRPWLYAGLAGTWLILGFLLIGGPRSMTVGFGHGAGALDYARNQCLAIVTYLRLTFWPRGLVIDYGMPVVVNWTQAAPYALVVLALLAATIVALLRRPTVGFLGAWFFVILSPTSSFVPIITEVAAERRMYLPLAAVAVAVVLAAWAVLQRLSRYLTLPSSVRRALAAVVAVPVLGLLALLTVSRNEDYRTPLGIWTEAVNKRPDNPRAHNNLAQLLYVDGKPAEAAEHLRRALALKPDYDMAHDNLSIVLAGLGDCTRAIVHSDRAIELKPDRAGVQRHRAFVLWTCGRREEAVACYQRAVELDPWDAKALYSLGNILSDSGRLDEAERHYRQAVHADPGHAEANNNLGAMLLRRGDAEAAVPYCLQAANLRPDWAEAQSNAGLALAACGRLLDAVEYYQRALRVNPEYAEARYNMGNALLRLERPTDAIAEYRRALEGRPDYLEARCNLLGTLRNLGHDEEAGQHQAEILRLAFARGDELRSEGRLPEAASAHALAARFVPDSAEAQYRFGRDLLELGRRDQAAAILKRCLQIDPDHAAAQEALASLSSSLPATTRTKPHPEMEPRP